MRRLVPVCLPVLLVLLSMDHALGQSAAEKVAMLALRLTTEASVLQGCEETVRVSDSDMEDLRKKIVRSGGNAALLTFDTHDMEVIHADVYRCAVVPK